MGIIADGINEYRKNHPNEEYKGFNAKPFRSSFFVLTPLIFVGMLLFLPYNEANAIKEKHQYEHDEKERIRLQKNNPKNIKKDQV
jgi:hypothetical protein